MPLYVYRDKCENFKNKDFDHQECDDVGLTMSGLGIQKITEDNIDELVFRFTFVQKIAYTRSSKLYSYNDMRDAFTKYLGLEVNCTELTRHKFMVNCARGLERDISWEMRSRPQKSLDQTKEAYA